MAATSAFSSDRGNAWMRQLMAPVGPEADKGAWPGAGDEDASAALTALPWQTGALRFPVGLPSGRTPLDWALATAASSLSWPVADNVRSISVLRRLEGLTKSRLPRSPGPELNDGDENHNHACSKRFCFRPPKRQGHRRERFLGLPSAHLASKGLPGTVEWTSLMGEMMTMMMMMMIMTAFCLQTKAQYYVADCMLPFKKGNLYVPDGILLEVSETLHYWTAATDGWGIGILLGLRQRVDATTDGGSAVPCVSRSCCPYLDTSPDV